jgi:hypothetical protein
VEDSPGHPAHAAAAGACPPCPAVLAGLAEVTPPVMSLVNEATNESLWLGIGTSVAKALLLAAVFNAGVWSVVSNPARKLTITRLVTSAAIASASRGTS